MEGARIENKNTRWKSNKNKPVRYHRHPGVVEPVRLYPSGHDQQPKGEVLILGCPNSVKLPPPDMINSRWGLLSS
jgi:hypothetical protein